MYTRQYTQEIVTSVDKLRGTIVAFGCEKYNYYKVPLGYYIFRVYLRLVATVAKMCKYRIPWYPSTQMFN